ncbi:hypothetical protein HY642_07440 [Candidatus Woesearchaeota archaeon]|nr:hypothetical protein [Candidatus Woesearchaeota archaeon]
MSELRFGLVLTTATTESDASDVVVSTVNLGLPQDIVLGTIENWLRAEKDAQFERFKSRHSAA